MTAMRRAMPRVSSMVANYRKSLGDEYVTQCQQRGLAGEPGWFYAWEGGLAVGTPWLEAVNDLRALLDQAQTPRAEAAFVVLRPKAQVQHGA